MTLRLSRSLLGAVVAHCRAEHPIEACGLIAGIAGAPSRQVPMRNAAGTPARRFAFGLDEQLAVWADMDVRGEDPVVIYHSHPAAEAVPSVADRAHAHDETVHYVIVSTLPGREDVRSYRLADGMLVEEPITCDAGLSTVDLHSSP